MKPKKEGHHPTLSQLQEFEKIRKRLLASGKDLSKIMIVSK